MKSKRDPEFFKKRAEKHFKDSVSLPYVRLERRALKAFAGLLSSKEQEGAEYPVSGLSGGKLVVLCDHPERIKEALLMDARDVGKILRRRLGLKSKEHARDA